jgi:hypothetical protein
MQKAILVKKSISELQGLFKDNWQVVSITPRYVSAGGHVYGTAEGDFLVILEKKE